MEQKIKIAQSNLKRIRAVLDISNAELGSMLGLTRQTIYNIETGKTKLTPVIYYALLYVLDNFVLPNRTTRERELVKLLLEDYVCVKTYVGDYLLKEEA